MDHHVDLRFRTSWRPLARAAGKAARATLKHQRAGRGRLTVVLEGEAEMRRLHRKYAGDGKPTDVLSFPDDSIEEQDGGRYFGDVIVCVPVARRQARAAGHSLETEISLLTVHGVLHLLGHDHADASSESRMGAAQAAILAPGPRGEMR
jgi:probable rRNA maturation factor